jgi:hypothetical protein
MGRPDDDSEDADYVVPDEDWEERYGLPNDDPNAPDTPLLETGESEEDSALILLGIALLLFVFGVFDHCSFWSR